MKKIPVLLLACLGSALLLINSCGPLEQKEAEQDFVVVFKDAKGLKAWDEVYMAGIKIGYVKSVDLVNGKVAAAVLLEEKYRNQVTTEAAFFIDADPKVTKNPFIRIRLKKEGGQPLEKNVRLTGIDSALAWKVLQYAADAHEIRKSAGMNNFLQIIDEWQLQFKEALNIIDLQKLDNRVREELDGLVKNLEGIVETEDIEHRIAELNEKLEELETLLQGMEQNQETKELTRALRDLRVIIFDAIERL